MKPVQIDFVPDLRWRTVWLVTAFVCAGIVGATGMVVWKSHNASIAARKELAAINLKIEQLRAPKQEVVDPRRDASIQAAKLLQYDLNKVFATVENLSEPGTRLASLSVDATASLVRLEYQLDSMPRAASVTAVLNAGLERSQWNLESVVATPAQQGLMAMPGLMPVRGVWSANLERL